ncbi:hypothetical protein [Campylobacter concisus]
MFIKPDKHGINFKIYERAYHDPKFSSQFLQVSGILKFAKQNKFKKYLFIYVNLLEKI